MRENETVPVQQRRKRKWVKVRAREERAKHLEGRRRSYTSQPLGNPAKKSRWGTQCLRQKSGEKDPAKTLYWRETDRAEDYTIFLLSEWLGPFLQGGGQSMLSNQFSSHRRDILQVYAVLEIAEGGSRNTSIVLFCVTRSR